MVACKTADKTTIWITIPQIRSIWFAIAQQGRRSMKRAAKRYWSASKSRQYQELIAITLVGLVILVLAERVL
jgi:hypothetical protein